MSQRVRLDANVILRFLRNDEPKQAATAAKLFQKAATGKVSLLVTAVTVNEVFFALTSFYKLSQAEAAKVLLPLIRSGAIAFEQERCLLDSLNRVVAQGVDFGDAYLAASAAESGDQVASFDRDLRRFTDIALYDLES